MGEIADDIVAGGQCMWCSMPFTQEHGYPVVCLACWQNASSSERKEVQKAVYPTL